MLRTWTARFSILIGILILFPAAVMAQEVAAPALPSDAPWWAQLLYPIIALALSAFAVPYLRNKAKAAKEEAQKLQSEGLANGLKARDLIIAQMKAFLLDFCANKAEKEMPSIAAKALAKELNSDQIKVILRSWGTEAREAAIDYFKTQGLDLVAMVGDKYLDDAIRWAADRVSPFPGGETAKVFLEEKASNWLVQKGVEYAREKWLDE